MNITKWITQSDDPRKGYVNGRIAIEGQFTQEEWNRLLAALMAAKARSQPLALRLSPHVAARQSLLPESLTEDGWCTFEGQRMRVVDIPERAWAMVMYDRSGVPVGKTIGELVEMAKKAKQHLALTPCPCASSEERVAQCSIQDCSGKKKAATGQPTLALPPASDSHPADS